MQTREIDRSRVSSHTPARCTLRGAAERTKRWVTASLLALVAPFQIIKSLYRDNMLLISSSQNSLQEIGVGYFT